MIKKYFGYGIAAILMVVGLSACSNPLKVLAVGDKVGDAAASNVVLTIEQRAVHRAERTKLQDKVLDTYKREADLLLQNGKFEEARNVWKKALKYYEGIKPTFTEFVKDYSKFKKAVKEAVKD